MEFRPSAQFENPGPGKCAGPGPPGKSELQNAIGESTFGGDSANQRRGPWQPLLPPAHGQRRAAIPRGRGPHRTGTMARGPCAAMDGGGSPRPGRLVARGAAPVPLLTAVPVACPRSASAMADVADEEPTPDTAQEGNTQKMRMTCGACGMVGHMRTNRQCPKYKESQGGGDDPPPDAPATSKRKQPSKEPAAPTVPTGDGDAEAAALAPAADADAGAKAVVSGAEPSKKARKWEMQMVMQKTLSGTRRSAPTFRASAARGQGALSSPASPRPGCPQGRCPCTSGPPTKRPTSGLDPEMAAPRRGPSCAPSAAAPR